MQDDRAKTIQQHGDGHKVLVVIVAIATTAGHKSQLRPSTRRAIKG